MFELNKIVRQNILQLSGYSSARNEFVGAAEVFLDANESPFGKWNRYPDPYQQQLKKRLAEIKGIDDSKIFLGNGSDEVIDLLFRIFCNPGKDRAMTFSPSYGMYTVSAGINEVDLIEIELNKDFSIDYNNMFTYLNDDTLKLVFICSPNNPTGNLIAEKTIKRLCANFKGIVVLDEAYVDFSTKPSMISLLEEYENLVVIQTLSKAWGLAALRIGMAFCSPSIVQLLNKIKPPYNISTANQKMALTALADYPAFEKNISLLLLEKEKLRKSLLKLSLVETVFPSDANFFLVKTKNAKAVYQQLVDMKIIVRNRNTQIKDCLRITVGTAEENKTLLKALRKIESQNLKLQA